MKPIKRQLQQVLQKQLFNGKAIIVIGARQVGKTTLFEQLLHDAHLPNEQILKIYCDDAPSRQLLENASLADLRQLLAGKRVVMVDEAQRIQGIGVTLKLITDHFKEVQLLVTGSSSFMLQGALNEPLTGRKFEYHLYPFSTQEIYANMGLIGIKQTFESRLIYGSYPDVVLGKGSTHELLMNLASSYMYQDLLAMESVRKPVILEKLLRALALQIGNEVSYNELAQTIGTDSKTVEKYVDLLEKCYIIFRLHGLSRNVRNELKRTKKIYFCDNGIRNALIQQFAPLNMRNDVGSLWENFFIAERIKFNHYRGFYCNTYFWRTTTQQEIDYIEEHDGMMTALEMKWNPKKANAKLPEAFCKAYDVKETAVITPENYLDWVM